MIRETLAKHSGLADFAFAMQGLGSGAITLFGAKLAVHPYDIATRDGDNGRAQTGKTFEHVVVDAAQLALGADGFGACGIPHHDVGVGARGEPAFSRIDIEDARDIG